MRSYARLLGASEQRREHFLQSGDEVVGFPIAFQQRFDGLVLDADLPFEKFILAFESLDIGCRDRSRQVGACRRFLSRLVVAFFHGDTCRDWSRHVAACRDRSHLLDVGDVLIYRSRRDQIFLAERGFDAAAVQVAFGAIALDATRRPGEAGARITLKRVVDCEREIAVGACRDKSRQVVGHGAMIPRLVPRLAGYPHRPVSEGKPYRFLSSAGDLSRPVASAALIISVSLPGAVAARAGFKFTFAFPAAGQLFDTHEILPSWLGDDSSTQWIGGAPRDER